VIRWTDELSWTDIGILVSALAIGIWWFAGTYLDRRAMIRQAQADRRKRQPPKPS